MEKKWIFPDKPNQELLDELTKSLNISSLMGSILINKGITNYEEAHNFFVSSLSNLHNPFLMKDMDKAIKRILYACENNENIMIYGDYDVDGITSIALLYWVFKALGIEVSYYIPNRLIEGYGLSNLGIDEAKSKGINLIISVDCGITALEPVEYAKNLGIDIIITDHHEPKDILPSAIAILNPKRKDSIYPYKELAGVGVAFKLAQALYEAFELNCEELENHLDLVALGVAADIVPLVDENRILTKFGFQKIMQTDKIGLRALLQVTRLEEVELNSGHIVFILAPRINAVGRLGDANSAVELLITEDKEKALDIAKNLNEENLRRRSIDDITFKEACQIIEENIDLEQERAIVLASSEWHKGVIGIVASRIVEKYYRPTVMIAIDKETNIGYGSSRSIVGFHLYNALKHCEKNLINFGGHQYAAGLVIDASSIPNLRDQLNQIAKEEITEEDLKPKIHIAAEINLTRVNLKLVQLLQRFAPFGPHNMRPILIARNLEITGTPRIVGKNHLKFKVRQDNATLNAIGFGFGDYLPQIKQRNVLIDMAFVLELNKWNNLIQIQARVKDIKIVNNL